MTRKKKPTARKPGGQTGNKNALKHGFYAKRFNQEETRRLESQEPTDVKAEIELLRVCIDRLAEQLDFSEVYVMGKDENRAPIQTDIRDDHYLKQLNTLSLMTQSIATLARTDHLIKGKNADVQSAILAALEELRLEMGL